MRRLLACLLLVACGDAEVGPDARTCDPLTACAWLEAYQQRLVGQLAGEAEISPGVRLAHRASVDERDATRTFLLDELAALGLDAGRRPYGTGANVLSTLLADGEPIQDSLIVGAHFDSVPEGPGAADNATGVALVLAAARYLATVPGRRRAVTFAFFDEEELGLIGSEAYVGDLTNAQVPIAEVHNFDMLSFDGDGDGAVELWSPSPHLEAAYRTQGEALGIPIQPVPFTFSDHQAFLDGGFAAVGVGEEFVADDHTPHYHQATDVYGNVDFAYLGAATRLALAVLEAQLTAAE